MVSSIHNHLDNNWHDTPIMNARRDKTAHCSITLCSVERRANDDTLTTINKNKAAIRTPQLSDGATHG